MVRIVVSRLARSRCDGDGDGDRLRRRFDPLPVHCREVSWSRASQRVGGMVDEVSVVVPVVADRL